MSRCDGQLVMSPRPEWLGGMSRVISGAAGGNFRTRGQQLERPNPLAECLTDDGAYLAVYGVEGRNSIANHAQPLRHGDVLVLTPQIGCPQVCQQQCVVSAESQLHDVIGWSVAALTSGFILMATSLILQSDSRFGLVCMSFRHVVGDSLTLPVDCPTCLSLKLDVGCTLTVSVSAVLTWRQAEGTHSE
jgi:hypothetical protein